MGGTAIEERVDELLARMTLEERVGLMFHAPFELPSSMDAVRAQLPDVPGDSPEPLFRFGHGLDI